MASTVMTIATPSWKPPMKKKKTSQLRSLRPAPLVSINRPPDCQSGGKLLQRRGATAVDNMDTIDRIGLAVNALEANVSPSVIASNVLFASKLTLLVTLHLFQLANSNMHTLGKHENRNPRSHQCLAPRHPTSQMQPANATELQCCMYRHIPMNYNHDRNLNLTTNRHLKVVPTCKWLTPPCQH